MPPAARVSDLHVCEAHPVPLPIIGFATTVRIGHLYAARLGDRIACAPTGVIAAGSGSVFIEGMPAARMGDQTAPKGTIMTGCVTVNIGPMPAVEALTAAAASGTPFVDCETCKLGDT